MTFTPHSYIEKYADHPDLKELLPFYMVVDAKKLADQILELDTELQEEFPQKVAAAILQYYMVINNIPFKKKAYAGIVQLTEVTINNTYKRIFNLMNA